MKRADIQAISTGIAQIFIDYNIIPVAIYGHGQAITHTFAA